MLPELRQHLFIGKKMSIEILKEDDSVIICVKPAGILSTDEPGGLPELVRETLKDPYADIKTVHRLDRVVSGLAVLARNSETASDLGKQIMEGSFEKEYIAVVYGRPESSQGTYTDLLLRDKKERKSYVVEKIDKGVQEAILDYKVLQEAGNMTLVRIRLQTGRTHQIRAQFSSRGMPIVGDKKYSTIEDGCNIALWSCRLAFRHPETGERIDARLAPGSVYPWNLFSEIEEKIRYEF